MKIRFIEERAQNNILAETENSEMLSAVFQENTQIYITKENKALVCEYVFNVLRVLENEIDIYVEITDIDEIS